MHFDAFDVYDTVIVQAGVLIKVQPAAVATRAHDRDGSSRCDRSLRPLPVEITESSVTAAQQMSAVFRTQRIFKIIFELISATNTLQAVLICDNGMEDSTHVGAKPAQQLAHLTTADGNLSPWTRHSCQCRYAQGVQRDVH
jgi:hypothetical protein